MSYIYPCGATVGGQAATRDYRQVRQLPASTPGTIAKTLRVFTIFPRGAVGSWPGAGRAGPIQ